jgi:nondiscriminating glutamyl-tRNA synthetase
MEKKDKKIKTRFAPSPTGFLHVGGLRTALYSYLLVKQNDGKFILRIEDTDRKRGVEKGTERIIETLSKFIDWDEGPKLDEKGKITETGENGPYIQSKRTEVYKKYVDKLLEEGRAYYCFCSSERLDKMRQEQTANKQAPKYDGHCRDLSKEEIDEKIKKGEKHVIRFKVKSGEDVQFEDLIKGKVSFSTNTIDDQVLMKSDGFPTYHLAVVVDDHLMGITHVIRGDEWLPSTPKHILLYQAFDWEVPKFAHLPLLLNTDRSKLSKRQGDVAVEDYLKKGYLKESLLNFIALLGWNPGEGSEQEVFSLEELIKKFDIKKVHKGGAVFDLKKLDWMNGQYIKNKSDEDLLNLAKPFLEKYLSGKEIDFDEEFLKKIIHIEKTRATKLSDFAEEIDFYFEQPAYEKDLLRWKEITSEEVVKYLETMRDALGKTGFDSVSTIQESLLKVAGDKRGEHLWPLRVALSGAEKSPSPFEIAWVIGKEESLKRINEGMDRIS